MAITVLVAVMQTAASIGWLRGWLLPSSEMQVDQMPSPHWVQLIACQQQRPRRAMRLARRFLGAGAGQTPVLPWFPRLANPSAAPVQTGIRQVDCWENGGREPPVLVGKPQQNRAVQGVLLGDQPFFQQSRGGGKRSCFALNSQPSPLQ